MTPEQENAKLREMLVSAHKALSFAEVMEGKCQRDFLKLDAAMAEMGFFPHRQLKRVP